MHPQCIKRQLAEWLILNSSRVNLSQCQIKCRCRLQRLGLPRQMTALTFRVVKDQIKSLLSSSKGIRTAMMSCRTQSIELIMQVLFVA